MSQFWCQPPAGVRAENFDKKVVNIKCPDAFFFLKTLGKMTPTAAFWSQKLVFFPIGFSPSPPCGPSAKGCLEGPQGGHAEMPNPILSQTLPPSIPPSLPPSVPSFLGAFPILSGCVVGVWHTEAPFLHGVTYFASWCRTEALGAPLLPLRRSAFCQF